MLVSTLQIFLFSFYRAQEKTCYGNILLLTDVNNVIILLLGINSDRYIYCLQIFFSEMRSHLQSTMFCGCLTASFYHGQSTSRMLDRKCACLQSDWPTPSPVTFPYSIGICPK
jgi:hypothetical protein